MNEEICHSHGLEDLKSELSILLKITYNLIKIKEKISIMIKLENLVPNLNETKVEAEKTMSCTQEQN